MKKNLLLILIFAGLAITTQAQNTYLNISNTPTIGGRFVIPNNAAINVTAAQSKTITFRIMVPSGVSNILNFAKIMLKNDTASAGAGAYGITFGSATTPTPHSDIRLVETSTAPLTYGNNNNTSLATTLNDGNWHHFALVLNDNTDPVGNPTSKSKLYYDGSLLITATNSTNIQIGPVDMTSLANLIFGASATGGSAINGMAIDDIRVWDSALTPVQINADKTTIINAATAPTTSGLLAAYDFQSPATIAIVPDITGKTLNANAIVGSSATALVSGSSNLANKEFNKTLLNVIIAINPTTDILNISAPQTTSAISVAVYDLSGKMVAASKSNDNTETISLSSMTSGVYLVKVTDGVSSYTQKIIKK
jgi:hypothetical protein